MLIGVVAFTRVIQQQHALVRSWRSIAQRNTALSTRAGGITVWLVPGEKQAVATLFGVREIWIGELLANHPHLDVAVAHEFAHHRLRHPIYEWLLTFARCVFWWNPVVWMFVSRARKEIEIECDEYCAKQMGTKDYQHKLARLMSDIESVAIGSAFGGRGSFNIERLRRLSTVTTSGWVRALGAFLIFSSGELGFVLVHAGALPEPEYSPEKKAWSVRFENAKLEKALEQIAELGGIDIYLDPRIEDKVFDFESE